VHAIAEGAGGEVELGDGDADAVIAVEAGEGLGVAEQDALFGAGGQREHAHAKFVALHPLEQGGVAAAIDDGLVDLPALLALGDAGLHQLAVDVHRQAGDRGVGRQREAVYALELVIRVVEECLVDRRAGDAVLDVYVDVHHPHRQRPLARPGREAGQQVAAAHRAELLGGVLQGVARPLQLVAQALGRASGGTCPRGQGAGLTGLEHGVAGGVVQADLAAQDPGQQGIGLLAQQELGAADLELAGGAADGEGLGAGHDVEQGLAAQELEAAGADDLQGRALAQDRGRAVGEGEGEGALAGVLEHGAGAELGGLQPGICPFGQVLVTGDAPDQEGGGGDGGEGVGGGGPAGLGHGDLGGARAL
jgi:hypothetical protein